MPTPASLAQSILELKQSTNTYGSSPLLTEIDCELVRRFERLAATDDYARDLCKRLRANLTKGIQDTDRIRQLHNIFAEGRIYYELLDRKVAIQWVPVQPENQKQTPDFTIRSGGEIVHVEVKAISMEGGDAKYSMTMLDGLDAKIDLEKQLGRGASVARSEQIISPLGKAGEPQPYSLRLIIEALITKIRNLIKPGQLKPGMTILVVDVGQFVLGCSHPEALLPVFKDAHSGTRGSGTLFSVAFGSDGQRIYRPAEFDGLLDDADHDGTLSQAGILKAFPDIDGLVVRYGWNQPQYLGLVSTKANQCLRGLVAQICDLSNDEDNSNEAVILKGV